MLTETQFIGFAYEGFIHTRQLIVFARHCYYTVGCFSSVENNLSGYARWLEIHNY